MWLLKETLMTDNNCIRSDFLFPNRFSDFV